MDRTASDDYVEAALQVELKSLKRQESFLSNRVRTLEERVEEKERELEEYKKALDQETIMKDSAVGKLTRVQHFGFLHSSNDGSSLMANPDYERKKMHVELELVEEELILLSERQIKLTEIEKKIHETDRRIASCQVENQILQEKIDKQESYIKRIKSTLSSLGERRTTVDEDNHLIKSNLDEHCSSATVVNCLQLNTKLTFDVEDRICLLDNEDGSSWVESKKSEDVDSDKTLCNNNDY